MLEIGGIRGKSPHSKQSTTPKVNTGTAIGIGAIMTAMTGDSESEKGSWDPFDDTPESEPRPPRGRRRSDRADRGAYRVLRAHFRAQCAARREPCHICGLGIDYRLLHPDRWCWELDHYVPVAVEPAIELAPSNWRASHSGCNRARATSDVVSEYGESSEDW